MKKGKADYRSIALKAADMLYPFITVGAVLIIWAVAAAAIDVPVILPGLGDTLASLGDMLTSGDFYAAVGMTLLRTFIGFFLSLALALVCAVAGAFFKPVRRLLSPFVLISRAVPTMSVILLCLLWVSNKILPVVVSVIIVFPVLYTNISGAINDIDPRLIQMARVYNVPAGVRIKKLYIPQIAPATLSAVRSTLGLTLKLMIAGEVMSNTAVSIGHAMNQAQLYLNTDVLLAYTIVAIVLSGLLEGAIILIRKYVVRWKNADDN